jgi:hypothetical protein
MNEITTQKINEDVVFELFEHESAVGKGEGGGEEPSPTSLRSQLIRCPMYNGDLSIFLLSFFLSSLNENGYLTKKKKLTKKKLFCQFTQELIFFT